MESNNDSKVVGAKSASREKRYELESAPGGWVRIRRLNHGESMDRVDTILTFKSGNESGASFRVLSNWKARVFDFAHCIVEHNLGDAETQLLFDFTKEQDVADLDEDIGDEIQGLINQHHGRIRLVESEDDDVPESDPNS